MRAQMSNWKLKLSTRIATVLATDSESNSKEPLRTQFMSCFSTMRAQMANWKLQLSTRIATVIATVGESNLKKLLRTQVMNRFNDNDSNLKEPLRTQFMNRFSTMRAQMANWKLQLSTRIATVLATNSESNSK